MDYVTSTDGTPIAVWRSGSGPPLLLVHGTGADHNSWAQVLPGLEPHVTVYTLDRRGRGPSGDAEAYSLEQEARDVAAAVAWIGAPVNLLGHSFGAACCLEAALLTPDISRLLIYEPPLPGMEAAYAQPLDQLEALIARDEREGAVVMFYREVVGVPEDMIEQIRAHPGWPDRVAAAHTLARETRVEMNWHPDFERFRAIQTPTLLLTGTASPAWAREITRLLAETLPNSRIHELPGQEHLAYRTDPDGFVAAVLAFIQG